MTEIRKFFDYLGMPYAVAVIALSLLVIWSVAATEPMVGAYANYERNEP